MIMSESGGNEGIGFAIPLTWPRRCTRNCDKDGRVRRGAVGSDSRDDHADDERCLGAERGLGCNPVGRGAEWSADTAGIKQGDVVLFRRRKTHAGSAGLCAGRYSGGRLGTNLHLGIQRGVERVSKQSFWPDRQNDSSQLEDLANYMTPPWCASWGFWP